MDAQTPGGLTRAGLLRALAGGGAVVAGGAAMGAWAGGDDPLAAPSKATDAKILSLFLTLEYAQEAFYREAVASAPLHGRLLAFARQVAAQEARHVAFLEKRLGSAAPERPKADVGDKLGTAKRFRDAAIELEEAAVAAYIGQGANLRSSTLAAVAPLVSVEARQVAWVRDLAGRLPAPRGADPGRKPAAVLADLRGRGFLA